MILKNFVKFVYEYVMVEGSSPKERSAYIRFTEAGAVYTITVEKTLP